MESEEVEYLKKRYRECPTGEKRIKFSDIENDLVSQFPSTSWNSWSVSRAVRTAFPSSESKKHAKSHHLYVHGIDLNAPDPTDSSDVSMLQQSLLLERKRVEELESQMKQMAEQHGVELEQVKSTAILTETLESQVLQLMHPSRAVYHGPDTLEHFNSFSIDEVITEICTYAPDLLRLLGVIGRADRHEDPEVSRVAQLQTLSSLTTLLKCRSVRVLGVQLLLTFMLIARATSKQAILAFNHLGVCVFYVTAWKYLRQLTQEAKYLELVQQGHWLWVYDNLNQQKGIRHEREDYHSKMMNVTARLAVNIRYLPDFPFDWSDTQHQRSRQSLTVNDFFPSKDDAQQLEQRAIHYLMEFLVEHFSDLTHLRKFVPPTQPLHPPMKSEVVPMKILFKDEKLKSDTIDILSQLLIDANLDGKPQIVVGDQLTCKVIRGCKLWRQYEVDEKDRLSWANEMPGDFHFLWECLKVVYMIFWGSPTHPGSLCHLREHLNRKQVDKAAKVFNTGDEFIMHCFKAHLQARICTLMRISSTSDSIPHEQSQQWLHDTAVKLLPDTLMPSTTDDPVFGLHRTFLHMGYLYVDLRNAIRQENGPHIIAHWKLWLPRFIATGCKNYATECVHLLTHLCADLPKHLAYIALHNRTINTEGKAGRGKPIDQMTEHYILVLKQAMRARGGNLTDTHIEELSLCALFLMSAAKKVDQELGCHQSSAHTVRDANKDISKMVQVLLEKSVSSFMSERNSPTFEDPTEKGLKKLCNTKWVHETLARNPLEEDTEFLQEDDTISVDLDYELSDVI